MESFHRLHLCMKGPIVCLLFLLVVCSASDNRVVDSSIYHVANITDDFSWGYDIFTDLGDSLVNAMGGDGFPWDDIVGMVSGEMDMEQFTRKIILFELPFLIVTAIFLLLTLCFPIGGLLFCCCRCCGKCGGTRKEEKISQLKRCNVYVMAPFIILLSLVIGFTTFLSRPVNSRLIDSTYNIMYTSLYSMYDIQTYADGIIADFDKLADEDFDLFSETLLNKLESVDEQIAAPLVRRSMPLMENISLNLEAFDNDLQDFALENDIFSEINSSVARITSLGEDLQGAMDLVAGNLTDIIDNCQADPIRSGAGVCDPLPDPANLEVDLEISEFSTAADGLNPEAILANTNGTLSQVYNLLSQVNSSLSTIPGIIRNNTGDLISNVNASLVEIQIAFQDIVESTTSIFEEGLTSSLPIEDLEDAISSAEMQKEQYKLLTEMDFILSSILPGGLLVVLSLLGLCMGLCGYNTNVVPSQQGGVANCGGRLSMCSAACGLVIAFQVCFVAALSFLIGSHLTLVCEGLQDLTVIESVLDNPSLWDGQHPLASVDLGTDSNITFYSILERCSEDASIADAVGLTDSELFDMGDTDFKKQIPDLVPIAESINSSFESLKFGSDTNLGSQFDGLANQLLPGNISEQLEELTNVMLAINLTGVANSLDNQAATLSGVYPSISHALESLATEIWRIKDEPLASTLNETKHLQELLNTLNSTVEDLLVGTSQIPEAADALNLFLTNDAFNLIFESLEIFIDDIVFLADSFMNETYQTVEEDIGRCGVIRLIYDSIVNVLCEEFARGMTLMWVSSVLYIIFLFPLICLNIRIAKYNRRPTFRRSHQFMTSNKVHPV
ncbi:Prominin-1 [Holothuria leucospilota]|uniref:Prominin-1 n=1 Tax=Holothuria leucospilota TaxID=206669 RepID=A0A9Q0YSZ6_HOLLE|nr:Prominin-1 [Holothuria leucospilota]